jgi:hypothetical protein
MGGPGRSRYGATDFPFLIRPPGRGRMRSIVLVRAFGGAPIPITRRQTEAWP